MIDIDTRLINSLIELPQLQLEFVIRIIPLRHLLMQYAHRSNVRLRILNELCPLFRMGFTRLTSQLTVLRLQFAKHLDKLAAALILCLIGFEFEDITESAERTWEPMAESLDHCVSVSVRLH